MNDESEYRSSTETDHTFTERSERNPKSDRKPHHKYLLHLSLEYLILIGQRDSGVKYVCIAIEV